jgi:hypothetical protein
MKKLLLIILAQIIFITGASSASKAFKNSETSSASTLVLSSK